MSRDAIEFVVLVLGSLAIVAGIIAMWNVFEHDREDAEAEAARRRLLRELDGHDR